MEEHDDSIRSEYKEIFSDKLYQKYLSVATDIGFEILENPVTEKQLLEKEFITPEDILKLRTYTENFLCYGSENSHSVQITRFSIKEAESGNIVCDLSLNEGEGSELDCQNVSDVVEDDISLSDSKFSLQRMTAIDENSSKHIVTFNFSADLLKNSFVTAMVQFRIGNQEIKNFRMIEMHFFKDKLLKIFDFNFGFCIPDSLNTWDHMYEIPNLPSEVIEEIIDCPYESRSETFYFVDGILTIHNKAEYSYLRKDTWD